MNSAEEPVLLSLENILEDPTSELFNEFVNFLNASYCIENLYFWLATQEYYQEFHNQQKKEQLCDAMVGLYIRPNSPQEINIPCDMRQSILDFYHTGDHHLHIFDDAAEAVLELMRVNSFLPWITTCSSHNTWTSIDSAPVTTTNMSKSSSSSSSSTTTTTTTTTSSSSSSNTATKKQHKSWPSPPLSSSILRNNKSLSNTTTNNNNSLNSSTSLTGLSSITDKWNLTKAKLNKQNSRKSCSSLDYFMMIQDGDHINQQSSSTSIPSAVAGVNNNNSNTRYKSMLKRVKKSLLGSGSAASRDDLLTTTTTTSPPPHQQSFTSSSTTEMVASSDSTTGTTTSFWRKSQR